MELFHASNQWATRPADQRFHSLEDMEATCRAYAGQAREKDVSWADLRVETSGNDQLALVGKASNPAILSNFVFGQLATRVGAPSGYLRTLPSTLAAQNLNYGLKAKVDGSPTARLLFHQNNGLVLRAATTDHYTRFWNYQVIARLRHAAESYNLIPARPTFRWDGQPVDGLDKMGSDKPCLYASDHDMFAFLMTEDRVIQDPMGKSLFRGAFIWNSEVGAASLGIMKFAFRDVCGNFIVWGASDIAKVSFRHVGEIAGKWNQAMAAAGRYLGQSAAEDEAKLLNASKVWLGADREKTLELVYAKKVSQVLTQKVLASGYDATKEDQDGSPNTVYGLVQGLTRYSQTLPYTDERVQVDRAAGKLLEATF